MAYAVFDGRLVCVGLTESGTVVAAAENVGQKWNGSAFVAGPDQIDNQGTVDISVFGDAGTGGDDSAVFQAAFDAIASVSNPNYGKVLSLRSGATYYLNNVIISTFFGIQGNGATIWNNSATHQVITSATTADTSIPDATSLGPMRGCAFYFTSLNYNKIIQDVTFRNYRFSLAYLVPHNTPTFRNVKHRDCNAGVFCYTGCQNYLYEGPITEGGNMGPLHISSATCFPTGSTYAGLDNYYTDGLTIIGDGGSIGGGRNNANFDTWFEQSILRPDTGSTCAAASEYIFPYAAGSIERKASGWGLFYMPFRNSRTCFGLSLIRTDQRGGSYRGAGFVDAPVVDLNLDQYKVEQVLSGATEHFRVGTFGNGKAGGYTYNGAGEGQVPFFNYTGRGASSGLYEASERFLTLSGLKPYSWAAGSTVKPGVNQGVVQGMGLALETTKNGYTGIDTRADGPLVTSIDTKKKISVGTSGDFLMGWNQNFTLPAPPGTMTNQTDWKRCIRIDNDGQEMSGVMTISAIKTATGEVDKCDYQVQTGTATLVIGNGVTIANGDTTITYASGSITTFIKGAVFQIGATGVYVTVDSVNTSTKVLTLTAPVSGLSSSYVGDGSTTTITKSAFCRMLTGWVKNGTVTTTSGSATVTGTGTKFTRDVKEGQYLYDQTTGKYLGQVQTIGSDTSITLAANTATVVTGVACCVRDSNWWILGFGVAPSFNDNTKLYLYNRIAAASGPAATSYSVWFDCYFRSFL